MTKANVSQLKAQLSAYLAEVRTGETVVVYDRATPIARLVPFTEGTSDLIVTDAPDAPATLKRLKGVRPKRRIDADALLRDLRRDR